MRAEDKRYLDKVAALGCWICRSPAEIHHITGAGMGRKSSNRDVIPLCDRHHRNGGFGVAVHAGTRTWEETFGNQKDMAAAVRACVSGESVRELFHPY